MHFYILMSNLEINSADWSVSRKMGIILLPSGQCDNRSAKAALLRCHQECLHPHMQACVRETESERQRTASIGEQRQRQRPLVQRCSGETGDRVCFRHHIWMCWNSPHARGHPICMHLTSTQEICGRCEKRNVTGGRKGVSFINSITTPCILILMLTTERRSWSAQYHLSLFISAHKPA